MKPPFTWEAFSVALAENPDFDPFTKITFHQVSRADRGVIAHRVMEARLARAKQVRQEAQQ